MSILKEIDYLLERKGGYGVRKQALEVYSKLKESLKSGTKRILGSGFGAITSVPNVSVSVSLYPRKLINDIDDELLPMRLEFIVYAPNTRGEKPGGQFNRRTKAIRMIKYADDLGMTFDESERWLKEDNDALVDFMDGLGKGVFIHEYTHFMDSQRSEGVFSGTKSIETKEDYANDPAELNAYFQQGMSKLQDKMEFWYKNIVVRELSDDPLDSLENILSPPDNDKIDEYLRMFMRSKWVDKLTDDNLKKIKKRIYTSVVDIQDNLKKRLKRDDPNLFMELDV